MATSIAVTLLPMISRATPGKLYRNIVVGLLVLFCLSNLGILATVLQVKDTLCAALTISIAFSFIVFFGILLPSSPGDKKEQLLQIYKEKLNIIVTIIET